MDEPRVRADIPPEHPEPEPEIPRPPDNPALLRPVPAQRVGDLLRRMRPKPADPDAEPTFGRMFGQFSVFVVSIFAIMVVLSLPCVAGLLILRR